MAHRVASCSDATSVRNLDQLVTKVDHQLTSNDRLSVRYFIDHFDNASIYNDDNLLTYRGGCNQSRVRTQNMATSWSKTFSPSLLNDFSFGYNRIHSRRAPPDNTPGMKDFGVRLPVYPTLASIAEINVNGFFNIGDNLEAKFVRNGFEWSDRMSWIRESTPAIRRRNRPLSSGYRERVPSGRSLCVPGELHAWDRTCDGGLPARAVGQPSTKGTGEYKNNRATYSALFFQDDYKVHPRLTLNLGMRYEPTPPWHEVRGRIERFRIRGLQARCTDDPIHQRACRSDVPWRSRCARRRRPGRLQQPWRTVRLRLGPVWRRQDEPARRRRDVLRPAPAG